MIIRFYKYKDHDKIHAIRDNGTKVDFTFPKKGPYPHDAVHVVVEKQLGLKNGFWGLVNSSLSPEQVGALAKEGGHASSTRADIPDAKIIELLQAERAVECFEAELWNPSNDTNTFINVLKTACEASYIAMPKLSVTDIEKINRTLSQSYSQWQKLRFGESISFNY